MFAYGNLTVESARKLSTVVLKYFGQCQPLPKYNNTSLDFAPLFIFIIKPRLSVFHSRVRGVVLDTGTNLISEIPNDVHKVKVYVAFIGALLPSFLSLSHCHGHE